MTPADWPTERRKLARYETVFGTALLLALVGVLGGVAAGHVALTAFWAVTGTVALASAYACLDEIRTGDELAEMRREIEERWPR